MNKIEWTTEGSNDLEIRREELKEFIRENLGKSENFDEDKEVSSSVENALLPGKHPAKFKLLACWAVCSPSLCTCMHYNVQGMEVGHSCH